jgi:hypothetical protein
LAYLSVNPIITFQTDCDNVEPEAFSCAESIADQIYGLPGKVGSIDKIIVGSDEVDQHKDADVAAAKAAKAAKAANDSDDSDGTLKLSLMDTDGEPEPISQQHIKIYDSPELQVKP